MRAIGSADEPFDGADEIGTAMDHGSTPPAPAVRSVLATYCELHDAESRTARDELEQLRGLLADAATRLCGSFERLSALAARAPGRVAPQAAANDAPGAGTVQSEPCATTDEIADAFGDAVRALQFHDIASRLVGHAAARLEALERMASVLTKLPDASGEDLRAALAAAGGVPRANPVSQGCMTGGGIELF